MPLHPPSILKRDLARSLVMTQVYSLSRVSDHIFCARVLVWSILDELVQSVDVVRRDDLRIGQSPCDTPRHSDFVERQIRITSDDGTSGEVNTLSHQVTAKTAFLPL